MTLVAVAKNHNVIAEFFCLVAKLINVVGGSCKRWDALRDAQFVEIEKALDMGEVRSGQGLNQETNLKRAGDTRWGSHYGTISTWFWCSLLLFKYLRLFWRMAQATSKKVMLDLLWS